ncbi:metal-dependent hydrolase [Zhongshania arctica]|uniref:Metal-dependent hydrolase n=1 Tax=Zhongshania arctica TaxID=3238302 RepID=A0ABV3TZM4_9GAMM
MAGLSQKISREVEIIPRDVSFEVATKQVPRYWFNDDPWSTHWMNALFSVVPVGERFICHTFADQLKKIKDPSIHKATLGLIRQERLHAREHAVMNETLSGFGVPLEDAEAILGKVLDVFKKYMSDETKLGFAAISEHFTASLSEVMFDNLELWDETELEIAAMMYWHFVEETEHKSVAFDVLMDRRSDDSDLGTYALRMATAGLSMGLFLPLIHGIWLYFVWKDGQLTNVRSAFKSFKSLMFGAAVVPKMFLTKTLPYIKPSFHPWDIDNRAHVAAWKTVYEETGDPLLAFTALREWHAKHGSYKPTIKQAATV